MSNKAVIDTIVSSMLDTDAKADKLIELIWNSWTETQRKEIADAAHRAALSKIESIAEGRLKAYRGNLFSELVEREVTRAFRASSAIVTINDLIKIELEKMQSELVGEVRKMAKNAARKIMEQALYRVDSNDLRNALRAVGRESEDNED